MLALRGAEGDQVEGVITERIGDDASQVAAAALMVLAERRLADLPDAVFAAAKHTEWSVRRAAARCLSTTSDPRAVSALRDLRQDRDPDVRRAAIDAISVSDAPGIPVAVTEDLIELGAIRGAALVSRVPIRTFDSTAAPTLLRILEIGAGIERGRRARAELREQNEESGQDVPEKPGDDDGSRENGLREDGQPKDRRTEPIKDPTETTVLIAAARAGQYLAEAGRGEIFDKFGEFLVRAAADSEPDVRLPAVAALVRFKDAAADRVLEILPSVRGAEAESIAKLLVKLRGPDARAELLAVARGERDASDDAIAGAIAALR